MAITNSRHATMDSDRREINVSNDAIQTDTIVVKTNTGNTATSTGSIDTKTGEVQASPTANTVLGRLKNIETNTADKNVTVNNSALNQVYTRRTPFKVSTEFTRPLNTTSYSTNDLINNSTSATTLQELDFSIYGDLADRVVRVTQIIILDSKGIGSGANPYIYIFNANTITGQSLNDNAAFNPSYTELRDKLSAVMSPPTNVIFDGSNAYLLTDYNQNINVTLSAASKVFFALVTNAAYTPESGEKFEVTLKGFIQ